MEIDEFKVFQGKDGLWHFCGDEAHDADNDYGVYPSEEVAREAVKLWVDSDGQASLRGLSLEQ